MNARTLVLLCLLPWPALAQGFAGLGTDAAGFAAPDPGHVLQFPRDHGPHPEFRIEWWYLTANLDGDDGAEYGVQWTLFRAATAPGPAEGWQAGQIYFGHAALTSADTHRVAERLARGGTGQAGVTAAPFAAWIDDWRMEGGGPALSALTLTARGTDFAYDLALAADGPLILHGQDGYSVKAESGQASHYYSQPFYSVSGQLMLEDATVTVTGEAWLDREWSSQPLAESQEGWDWLSLRFEDGSRLMGFQLRDRAAEPFVVATWIGADGVAESFGNGALSMQVRQTGRVAGREIPLGWRITLPARGLDVDIAPLNPQAWMDTGFPYWEGPVRATGSHSGRGYLEMTGY